MNNIVEVIQSNWDDGNIEPHEIIIEIEVNSDGTVKIIEKGD